MKRRRSAGIFVIINLAFCICLLGWIVTAYIEVTCYTRSVTVRSFMGLISVCVGGQFQQDVAAYLGGTQCKLSYSVDIMHGAYEPPWWRRIGLVVPTIGYEASGDRIFCLPYWTATILLALPILRLWLRRLRKLKPNECVRCRYDLTGCPSGRCPECGTEQDARDVSGQ